VGVVVVVSGVGVGFGGHCEQLQLTPAGGQGWHDGHAWQEGQAGQEGHGRHLEEVGDPHWDCC